MQITSSSILFYETREGYFYPKSINQWRQDSPAVVYKAVLKVQSQPSARVTEVEIFPSLISSLITLHTSQPTLSSTNYRTTTTAVAAAAVITSYLDQIMPITELC